MKSFFPYITATGLLFAGCMNTEAPSQPSAGPIEATQPPSRNWAPEENAGFLEQLKLMGFDSSRIVDHGDYYLVEEDIYMMKSDLGGKGVLAKTSQYRTQYLVRDNKIHNLTVRVDPSFAVPGYDWRQAAQNAIAHWNAMGYFVKFTYVTGTTSDILIKKIPSTTNPGASSFPNSAGAPGQVSIAFNAEIATSSATRILVHHLGHAVGLAHTDNTPASGINPYAPIPSTPASEPYVCCPGVGYSVMNSNVYFEDPFIGFSFGDNQAMRRLYSSHIKATPSVSLRLTGDANGDGKKDLITFDQDGVVVSLANSSGTGFLNETLWNSQYGSSAASGGWGGAENPRMLADVNGDGKVDVVGFGNAGVFVALSNGSSFVSLSQAATTDFTYNSSWRAANHVRTLADVNGDGKADIVGFGSNDVVVALSNGNGTFGGSQIWHNSYAVNDSWSSVTDFPRYVVDVTGDGKADIVGIGGDYVFVSPSQGNRFDPAANQWLYRGFCYNDGWRDNTHIRTFADVDGDGKQDLVGFGENDVYVGYSTGAGFNVALGSSSYGRSDGYDKARTIRLMADMNGDLKADVVAFGEHETQVALSSGSRSGVGSVFSPSTWSNDFDYDASWRNSDHLRTAADVNGDGKADIIAIGYNEGVVGVSTGSSMNAALFY